MMDAHQHDEAWFCLVLAGGYEERIRSRANDHLPGDLLYCPAHAVHEQRFGAAGARKLLFSPDENLQALLREHGVHLDEAPSVRRSARLLHIGDRLAAELEIDDPFASLSAQGLALELVAALGRGFNDRADPSPPLWLRRLRDCLHDDPAADVSLDRLAAVAGRHPVHVSRSFHAFYGVPVGDYVRRLRVEKAAVLLRSTRRPLIDIAIECGFAGAAQFSRSFRAAFDSTPSSYRKAVR
ncbi:AraC family transcriptional regulator [Luteibacter rhizovicinus]|uniref:AraC family transcriptional regulator n=2 Tax=Luteibacter rhizovicinus TaxID=242606 RepID=A0A4R3YUL6_9GAMM|nr:AraC family transcriptional regulator [Luteibacter rhizovicinus]